MSGKILEFNGITKEADLEEVVIIGFDKCGEFYFSSNKADGGCILWLMEVAKKKLLEIDI